MSTPTPLYKRIEVWVLLLLSTGATLWVLSDGPATEDGAPEAIEAAETTDTPTSSPALTIHRCVLERDYGNARLDIELRYRNASPRPLVLQPPDVRLLSSDGKEVPPYILPTEPPPQIPARTAQSVRLRYWLEAAHLQGALRLEIRGSTAEVKNATAMDLQTLPNHQPKTWQGSIP
ncbi:MAG: hypothetical protein LDL31_01125 [Prosthecobacter sp.]|jgi:hypothetical protein|nr:hypothetical protein [Prosthecobacter sp.]